MANGGNSTKRKANRARDRSNKKGQWTERRLQRLFTLYNRRFWRGSLPIVQISISDLGDSYGRIEWKRREIKIDIGLHTNDRQIRATLLHEMAHLATPRKAGHGSEFWCQIERLLRQKAPITVAAPETPGLSILEDVVPRRFPLARRMMNRAEKQRQRKILKWIRKTGCDVEDIRKADITRRFEEVAYENLTWRQSLFAIGGEHGLIDVDGKATNRWAADLIVEGRRAHARGRRNHISHEKRRRELEAEGFLRHDD